MKSLPKTLNRSIIYYKITNEEEVHGNLQYKTGLVIDVVEFDSNPKHSCVKGGIYFTTKEYLHRFFGYGKWIRPVIIPENAQVVLDPERDKYRTDRLIFEPRKTFKFYFDYLFDKETFPKEDYNYLTKHCLDYFDKWFNKKTFPEQDYWLLAIRCSEHFDKWFDGKIFQKRDYAYLAQSCSEHFDRWFDKKTFPKSDYWYLARYCPKWFNKWFDKETFPKKGYWYLIKHCSDQLRKRKIKL